jgi:hypothetical protein
MFAKAHKQHERFPVKAGEHLSRVYRLVDEATGEFIGDVVQPVHGPTIVAIVHSSVTTDRGETFRRITTYLGERGALETIGEIESDPERIEVLRSALTQWMTELGQVQPAQRSSGLE